MSIKFRGHLLNRIWDKLRIEQVSKRITNKLIHNVKVGDICLMGILYLNKKDHKINKSIFT